MGKESLVLLERRDLMEKIVPKARAVLGYVTCPNVTVATELATKVVKAKLAACGNIIPGITSVYEWQGVVETESEVSLLLKTMEKKQEALTAVVVEHHPYDTPCVVFVPIEGGHTPFLEWIEKQTGTSS